MVEQETKVAYNRGVELRQCWVHLRVVSENNFGRKTGTDSDPGTSITGISLSSITSLARASFKAVIPRSDRDFIRLENCPFERPAQRVKRIHALYLPVSFKVSLRYSILFAAVVWSSMALATQGRETPQCDGCHICSHIYKFFPSNLAPGWSTGQKEQHARGRRRIATMWLGLYVCMIWFWFWNTSEKSRFFDVEAFTVINRIQ